MRKRPLKCPGPRWPMSRTTSIDLAAGKAGVLSRFRTLSLSSKRGNYPRCVLTVKGSDRDEAESLVSIPSPAHPRCARHRSALVAACGGSDPAPPRRRRTLTSTEVAPASAPDGRHSRTGLVLRRRACGAQQRQGGRHVGKAADPTAPAATGAAPSAGAGATANRRPLRQLRLRPALRPLRRTPAPPPRPDKR